MKKMSIAIVVVVVIILLVVIVPFKKNNKFDSYVMDGDGMINPRAINSFSYNRGGGELGAYFSLYLNDTELLIMQSEGNGSRESKKKTKISYEDIDAIQDIIGDAGIRNWGELPASDMFALDEEVTSVSIGFSDGTHVQFDSNKIVPDGGWPAINSIVDILIK